jgi:hypothetical protein
VKRELVWKNGALFWNDLLGALGVAPGVKVIGADLKHVLGVRRGLFSNGKQRTVILACASDLPAGEAMLVLPSRSHVVDLRENKYLGFQDRVPLVAGAGKGFAFSIFPKVPGKIQLNLPEKVKAGDAFTIAARVPGSDEGVRVLRFVTTGPSGKTCPWFRRRVVTESAEGVAKMVAAWNDTKGTYHVEVTDVASASRATGTFEIVLED